MAGTPPHPGPPGKPSDRSPRSKPTRRPPRRERRAFAGLALVATPIGNLSDVTLRALAMLAAADVVACEDTRVTAKLLRAHGLDPPLVSYNDHNAARVRPRLIKRLERGETVALVSDAGTPLVSDPGYKLVRAAIARGIAVTTAPGPSAALAALLLSGLPSDRFLFAGFLPPRAAARRTALLALETVPATLVFFESARRLAPALADMAAVLGDRPAAVAREMTKLYEEVRRDGLAALAAAYRVEGAPRGEVVIVIAGAEAAAPLDDAALDARLRAALATHSLRDAVAEELDEQGRHLDCTLQNTWSGCLTVEWPGER